MIKPWVIEEVKEPGSLSEQQTLRKILLCDLAPF
jgi:hypothetical protein